MRKRHSLLNSSIFLDAVKSFAKITSKGVFPSSYVRFKHLFNWSRNVFSKVNFQYGIYVVILMTCLLKAIHKTI